MKEEESKLIEDSEKNYSIHAIALRKEYKIGCKGKKVAVQKASIGLKQGEVFALLGTNGAGKTTTFKMLTFEVMPTSGLICINGLNIHKNFNQIRQAIGYCPQFDTLFPYLTVYENLIYYACIKKIMPNERKLAIQNVIHELSLHAYTNIQAGKLSGGNKRKLSVAIAMIGNPSILLLDEPSTGMDPEARRFMWEVISKISKKRQHSSVIITTHSMEEAEALASKIGIMANGKFRCIGSAQHLKSIYGQGYEICVRVVQPTQQEIQELCEKCGLQLNSLLDFENTKILMGKSDMSCLINEIVEKGTGSDFKAEFDAGRMVRAEYVSLYIMIEKIGVQIEKELLSMFENYELIEHYFSTYKYKVPRSKHLSEIFELLCRMKKNGLIIEYSVTQTTLEQIFNAFALEDENQLFRKISKKDLPKA